MSVPGEELRRVLDADYPSAQRFALYRIAEVVNAKNGWRWFRKNADFADEIGVTRQTVSGWMAMFVADGWLVVEGRSTGGRSRPTEYRWASAKVSGQIVKVSGEPTESVRSADTQVVERVREKREPPVLFDDDDFVEWKPTALRIERARCRLGSTDEEIERATARVNVEGLTGAKAYRRWADLLHFAIEDRWKRGERPRFVSQAEQVRPQPPVHEPAPASDEDRAAAASRIAALRRARG